MADEGSSRAASPADPALHNPATVYNTVLLITEVATAKAPFVLGAAAAKAPFAFAAKIVSQLTLQWYRHFEDIGIFYRSNIFSLYQITAKILHIL